MGALLKLDQSNMPVFEKFDANTQILTLLREQYHTLSKSEFDQFIATSSSMGLNPVKRQIAPIIFNAKNPNKRQMAIVTTIMGLRAIADRTLTYRPDPETPRFETSKDAVSNINPIGLISCSVAPQKYAQGQWSPCPAEVFWDELAPIVKYGDEPPRLDKRTPWPTRPRGQLAKCAEADALRRGWPEDFSNIYVEEEVQRSGLLDASPSELAEAGGVKKRLEMLNTKNTITMVFDEVLETIPIGDVHDRCEEFINKHRDVPQEVKDWQERNRVSLKHFWAHHKGDALNIRKLIEGVLNNEANKES